MTHTYHTTLQDAVSIAAAALDKFIECYIEHRNAYPLRTDRPDAFAVELKHVECAGNTIEFWVTMKIDERYQRDYDAVFITDIDDCGVDFDVTGLRQAWKNACLIVISKWADKEKHYRNEFEQAYLTYEQRREIYRDMNE